MGHPDPRGAFAVQTQPGKAVKTPWDGQFLPGRSQHKLPRSSALKGCAFPLSRPATAPQALGCPHPPWTDSISLHLLAKGQTQRQLQRVRSEVCPGLCPTMRAANSRCHRKSIRSGQAHLDASQLYCPRPQLSAACKLLNLKGYVFVVE